MSNWITNMGIGLIGGIALIALITLGLSRKWLRESQVDRFFEFVNVALVAYLTGYLISQQFVSAPDRWWVQALGALSLMCFIYLIARHHGWTKKLGERFRVWRINRNLGPGLRVGPGPEVNNYAEILLDMVNAPWGTQPHLIALVMHDGKPEPLAAIALPFGSESINYFRAILQHTQTIGGELPFKLEEPLVGLAYLTHGYLSKRNTGDERPPGNDPKDEEARYAIVATVGGGMSSAMHLRRPQIIGALPEDKNPLTPDERDNLGALLVEVNRTWEPT
jgi:hypothetical protein